MKKQYSNNFVIYLLVGAFKSTSNTWKFTSFYCILFYYQNFIKIFNSDNRFFNY